MEKAIFLDRDGTINVDYGYVYKTTDLYLIPGVEDSLLRLQNAGFLLIIITNQSGVGRNLFTKEDALRFNQFLVNYLKYKCINVIDVFMCIHAPEENCNCRKPSPFLINKALIKYNINPKSSYMLGDKLSDVEAGLNAGVKSFLITKENDLVFWTNKILEK